MKASDADVRDVQSSGTARVVVLIGFMGSGKSSIARRLAWRLKCRALDLDKRLAEQCGASIAQLFAERGEAAFRAAESAVLQDTLREATRDRAVLSTGGGIVKNTANREALRVAAQQGALVVYLRARPATLAQRIRRQPGTRPLIDGEEILDMEQTQARVEALLGERAALYEECAGAVVDTDHLALHQVVETILRRLRERDESRRRDRQGDQTWDGKTQTA